MGLEPCEKGNSSYLRGQGVKNKLLTLELKLLSSVNGLFLTGACIVKAEIFYNINFISNGTDSYVVDYILFIRNKCIYTKIETQMSNNILNNSSYFHFCLIFMVETCQP